MNTWASTELTVHMFGNYQKLIVPPNEHPLKAGSKWVISSVVYIGIV
jgi:hypothetical protein